MEGLCKKARRAWQTWSANTWSSMQTL